MKKTLLRPGQPRRTVYLARTRMKSGGRIKSKKRAPSEAVRIYGPPERREWTKTLPCRTCGLFGYTEAAHVVKGDGGTGYKASAQFTAPLCGLRPKWEDKATPWGCHRELHRIGPDAFESKYGVSLETLAAEHNAAWEAVANG